MGESDSAQLVGSAADTQRSRPMRLLRRILPAVGWFDGYSLARLRLDLVAGVTVALVLIPQSMAYAQLAGLPAYYGLYAAFLPPMIASLFGSSHQLATGPVAIVSLMTAASLEPFATEGSVGFIAYAVVLSILVGVFQFLLGVLRLGLVVNFLSHPVVRGFTNAGALIIASSQLSKMFGVYVDKAEHHYETVWRVCVAAFRYTHWPTLALGLLAIAIMVVARRLDRRIPNVLVAVVVTTLISWAIGFERRGTASIDDIAAVEVREQIHAFNVAVDEFKEERAVNVARTAKLKAAEDAGDAAARMEIGHEIAVAGVRLAALKERAHHHRAFLRSLHLEAVAGGDRDRPTFQLAGSSAAGEEGDGRIWRIRVGHARLDTSALRLTAGGAVVGLVPKGLRFQLPNRDREGEPFDFLGIIPSLLPAALIISLLGFMEAISIAKAMAARTGQRLDPNQELIGQGLANILGSFAQSYPVSGSFSRSAVNLQAGALTGLSNVFSSSVVFLTLMFFTPLLYHLPQSVLASIIMMAVIGLVSLEGFAHAWRAHRHDGAISVITFVLTLYFAPHLDRGIIIGVGLSIGLYLLRTMKPDIALLSRSADQTYRSAARRRLVLCRHIAVVRFDGALFFVNVNYLEEKVLEQISVMPELRHILIVGDGINELDASGEEMLSTLVGRLRGSGYDVSLSGLNDNVLEVLRRTRLYERIGEDHLFPTVTLAVAALHGEAHRGSDESVCPLLEPSYRDGAPIDSASGGDEAAAVSASRSLSGGGA